MRHCFLEKDHPEERAYLGFRQLRRIGGRHQCPSDVDAGGTALSVSGVAMGAIQRATFFAWTPAESGRPRSKTLSWAVPW